jgi:hypothetical protein
MANTRPFGSSQDNSKNTSGKGDIARDSGRVARDEQVDSPKKVNQELWEQAEIAWRNQSGGHGVSSESAKREQIKKFYDQMIDNDKKAKAWEGKE